MTGVKEQEICRIPILLLYTSWLVNSKEWLTNAHIDVFQNLIYENYKYQGFIGFVHPSK